MQTDPIADMLTRIRNAQAVSMPSVSMSLSKIKVAIAKVLKNEGYIAGYTTDSILTITLKYYKSLPVISSIDRKSRPGLRVYVSREKLSAVYNSLGIAIVSTSKGVMSEKNARRMNLGGELLCHVT